MTFSKRALLIFMYFLLFIGPNLKNLKCSEECSKTIRIESKSMSSTAGSDDDCDYTHSLRNQMYNYFYHMYDYSPSNYYGTCGYVSLIQVLSYYDNFYDDRIIENTYNNFKKNQSSYLLDSELISPGVAKGDYKNQYGSLAGTVTATCSFDYQYELIRRYKKYLDSKEGNENNTVTYDNSLNASQALELVNNCLTYKPKSYLYYRYEDLEQNELKTKIKDNIDKGFPVIVNIVKGKKLNNGSWESGHAVVAYDYLNNNIYANFGWNESETHKPLTYQSYDKISSILVLEFGAGTDSKLNYQINGNKIDYLSYYNRAILNPSKYSSSNGNPTFIWKHSSDSTEYFDVEIGTIKTDNSLSSLISGTTSFNRFILSYKAQQYLYAYAQAGKGIYITIKRYEKAGLIKYNPTTSYFYPTEEI